MTRGVEAGTVDGRMVLDITWQVDVLRYATIGASAPATLLVQGTLFVLSSISCFGGALWAFRRQE